MTKSKTKQKHLNEQHSHLFTIEDVKQFGLYILPRSVEKLNGSTVIQQRVPDRSNIIT